MQVNHLKHLSFPTDKLLPSMDKDSQAPADAATAARSRSGVEPPRVTEQVQVGSVVLKLAGPGTQGQDVNESTPALYSGARKPPTIAGDDTDAMARAHQAALERNAGVVTRLTVGSDGVMVAKPRTAFSAHEPDFVSFAVSAMREFADEAQPTKAAVKGIEGSEAPAAPAPHGNFFGIQKLAAKLHLFA
jgi:hypothetical protein